MSFPETYSEQGLIDKIKLVAHVMDVDARGACLTTAVSNDLAELKKLRDDVKQPARVMFVMSFLNGRAMVAGQKDGGERNHQDGRRRQRRGRFRRLQAGQ